MSKIRSNDEPVGRMAKLMAELHYFMAKEMIDRLGQEKGKEAVRAAIRKFGKARIENMKEEVQERGLEANAETYAKVKDMPSISWKSDPDNPCDITYCPMHDMWQQLGAEDIGALYCEIDSVMYDEFGIGFKRPLCKTNGDKCCRFIVTDKKFK